MGISYLPISGDEKSRYIIYVDDVPGSGPGNPPEDFTSIQDAIDYASQDDTIYVFSGVYFENININKYKLSVLGDNNYWCWW